MKKRNVKHKVAIKKAIVMKAKKIVSRRKKKNVIRKNKKLILMALTVLVVVITAVETIIFQKVSNDNAQPQISSKASADALKTQAIQSLHSNPATAKTLFQQAREKYQAINDTNNIVDVEAQLYLIEHTKNN